MVQLHTNRVSRMQGNTAPSTLARTTLLVSDCPQTQAFSSLVKVDFWTELATKKLDTYRLNDDAQVGFLR